MCCDHEENIVLRSGGGEGDQERRCNDIRSDTIWRKRCDHVELMRSEEMRSGGDAMGS
jgi:hypothetical protein